MSYSAIAILAVACAVVFVVASATTVGLLVRAQWARRPDGTRRPPRTRGRYELWPDLAGVTPAARPYERLARRTALVACLALVGALVALGAS
jgi:hypothetical protein